MNITSAPSLSVRGVFYMVHNMTTKESPKHRHDTLKSAVEEAQRLAIKQAGDEFVVLKSIESYQVDVPQPRKIHHSDITTSTTTGSFQCSIL